MTSFYYGVMGAGKTTELIKTYDIYRRKGLEPVVIKSPIDTREGSFEGWGTTQSRITQEKVPCYFYKDISEVTQLSCKSILVDEAQFMSKADVKFLIDYVDSKGLPLLAYGLKTDVNGDLFEGASAWLALADNSKELECLCQYPGCMEKAVAHSRYVNGVKDTTGNPITIETGKVLYKSLCRKHWREM